MKQNKLYLSAAVLGLVVTTLTVSSLVSATSGEGKKMIFSGERKGMMARPFDPEKHQEMKAVLEQGDFETWRAHLAERCPNPELVNEENFEKFKQIKELLAAGNYEEAEKIKEELGLPDKRPEFGRKIRLGQNEIELTE